MRLHQCLCSSINRCSSEPHDDLGDDLQMRYITLPSRLFVHTALDLLAVIATINLPRSRISPNYHTSFELRPGLTFILPGLSPPNWERSGPVSGPRQLEGRAFQAF